MSSLSEKETQAVSVWRGDLIDEQQQEVLDVQKKE
jgi:hypothetical protein